MFAQSSEGRDMTDDGSQEAALFCFVEQREGKQRRFEAACNREGLSRTEKMNGSTKVQKNLVCLSGKLCRRARECRRTRHEGRGELALGHRLEIIWQRVENPFLLLAELGSASDNVPTPSTLLPNFKFTISDLAPWRMFREFGLSVAVQVLRVWKEVA